MRRRSCASSAALAAILLSSCAKAPVTPPQIREEYVRPRPRPAELQPADRRALDQAWIEILAGQGAKAEKRLLDALRGRSVAHLDTGLAWARLRSERVQEADALFQAAVQSRPRDVSALAGAGATAARLGAGEVAVEMYRRALAEEPGESRLARRLAELKLAVTEKLVGQAQAAQSEGRAEAALEAYSRALVTAPELASVRLAAAEILVSGRRVAEAIAVLEADPIRDRAATLRLVELLIQERQPAKAVDLLRLLAARDHADAEIQRALAVARQEVENLRMPEPYRRIPEAARLTRADLAALLVAKLPVLERLAASQPSLAVDVSGSWSRPYIVKALALGLLEVYPNHTFQPGATIRKGDLAMALSRVLDHLGHDPGPGPVITDMSRTHLQYSGAVRAAAAGLLSVTPSGAFEPWRPVSGAEAVQAIEALARQVRP